MFNNKRVLQWAAACLLLLFPASLFGAAFQVVGTGGGGAIDTLTVEDGGGAALANAAGNVDVIIFNSDPSAGAAATRDRIVLLGISQLDCRFFRIHRLGPDRFQINATGGRFIASVKLNGSEITTLGDTTNAGQVIKRNDANQNPDLPACGRASSLSFYSLLVLALLLAATSGWMFRRRRVSAA